jgi:hypothetical protein
MKVFLSIIIVLFSISLGFAQTKKIKWSSDWCDYESTYDASKYSATQLRDTLKLMKTQGLLLEFDASPQDLAGVDKLNIANLESEYLAKKRSFENLKLVKSPYFENLRKRLLKQLEQTYQL